MENFAEMIKQFFSSPEMVALVSSAVAYLTANLGTIILFAVKYIKLKTKELKEKALHEQTIEALTKEYQLKVNELTTAIDTKLDELDAHVCDKLDKQEEVKKEMIKEQSVQLEEAITETKKSLNIDEILEEK